MTGLLAALSPLALCAAIVLSFLLAFFAIMLVNLAGLPRLRRFRPPAGQAPFVSVLVPARDEAANIEACVRGLLALDYPAFEVIVLDDGSTDGTGAILARLAAGDPRLQVMQGGLLPPGWLGKANACRQLAAAARGDLLLFTDADVRHAPALLGHAVGTLEALDVALLSIFPTQVTVTPAERLLVPLMQHFAVYVLLPLPLMRRLPAPAFAAANGQFLLFRRAAYESFGGHAAVRGAVLEDVGLARATKAAGYPIALADGDGLIACRMYHSAAEVWAGFAKNLFAFFNRSWSFLGAAVLAGLVLWVLPLPLALWGSVVGDGGLMLLGFLGYAVAVAMRAVLAWRFGGHPADAFLHPVAVAALLALAVYSARLSRRGGAVWKGRPVGG